MNKFSPADLNYNFFCFFQCVQVIVDRYGKPEILFLGPDEGTAEFMDWASEHAKMRGASFWKAFTTGKSQRLGGIPHDLFGMTTHSIHQYVLGIYEKLSLKVTLCKKTTNPINLEILFSLAGIASKKVSNGWPRWRPRVK